MKITEMKEGQAFTDGNDVCMKIRPFESDSDEGTIEDEYNHFAVILSSSQYEKGTIINYEYMQNEDFQLCELSLERVNTCPIADKLDRLTEAIEQGYFVSEITKTPFKISCIEREIGGCLD